MCKINDPLKVLIDDQDREAITYALCWIKPKLQRMSSKEIPPTLLKAVKGLEHLDRKINTAAEAKDDIANEWLAETKELLEKKK